MAKKAATPPVIRVRGISMERSGARILSGVDWEIRRGQHWALLGANGSGKTSLLKVITGYEWPTTGSVQVLGETFGECDLHAIRRHVGWASSSLQQRIRPDETGLRVVLSGFEASIGLYREFSETEIAAAAEAMEAVGAGLLQDAPYGVLSQGERQRVLLARSFVHRPSLLILDEPCAGLDPAAREAFLDDVEGFMRSRNAPTIIFVTHHVEEIRVPVSHTLVLKGGSVLSLGRTEEVLTAGILTEALDRPCEIWRENGHYRLQLGHS